MFQYISITLNLPCNKNELYKTLGYRSRKMLIFDFSEKGMRIVCPPHLVHDFSRKMFLMLYFTVWLPFFLEKLGKIYIAIVCFRGCGIPNFRINLIFLINLFFYTIKESGQTFTYLENKESFSGKLKSIFHHVKGLCLRQKLSQTWECAFKWLRVS